MQQTFNPARPRRLAGWDCHFVYSDGTAHSRLADQCQQLPPSGRTVGPVGGTRTAAALQLAKCGEVES